MAEKNNDPYAADELKARLIALTRQYYNNTAQDSAVDPDRSQIISELTEAADPARLAVALIDAIAETWGENNRRIMDYSRRTGFGGKKY